MAISGIGATGTGYDNIASGSSIVTAADNPSGLAISEKLESAERGYDAATDNAKTTNDALKTADGGMQSIMDSLQEMREISVRASNTGTLTGDDVSAMQDRINELVKNIQDSAKGTQFNQISLLDGSQATLETATNPSGSGMSIQLSNSTADALGIAGYDVTGNFDIQTIDDAIAKVSESLSSNGAQSNALESIANYNSGASAQMTASKSSLEDLDIGKAVSEQKKDEVLEQYKYFVQKQKDEESSLIEKMFK